ncbi:MAG: sensor histidine kinase [Betaproteobacteria bacterium]
MSSKPIDWSQFWYPGRRQPFTADEMARAGADAPSRTLQVLLLGNVLLLLAIGALVAPKDQGLPAVAMILALAALGAALGWWLWWRPWRQPLMLVQIGMGLVAGLAAASLSELVPDRESRTVLGMLLVGSAVALSLLLWFLVVWRAQQIEARLAEMAERAQAIEMARRLAAAQLEPHFLFNTLSSLQHWVDTRDERASPLLTALTGYLRATLPMFKQPTLPLADECLAVERYLQVMQARLGARLAWGLDIEPALRTLPLPSGALLTLVENAVQHGIEPSLRGGTLQVRARRHGALAEIEVVDDGAGLPAQPVDGVGLTNVRQRLALLGGPGATLALAPRPEGGCIARLTLPAPNP